MPDTKKQSNISLLNGFVVGVKRYFLLSTAFTAVSIILNFLVPQIIRMTVDNIIGAESIDSLPVILLSLLDFLGGRDALRANLILCAVLILAASGGSGLFSYFSRMNNVRFTESFSKNLRDTLFEHIQHLPFRWHTEHQTGDIIQRCTSDVETVREFVSRHLIEIVRTVILIVTALFLMFSMNVKMALISTAFIPLIALYSTVFYGRISRQFQTADEAEGDLMTGIQENLTGARVVRAFGREKYERDVFEDKLGKFTENWIDLGYTLGLYWGIGDFSTGAQLLAIVCSGAYFAAVGEITLGEMLVFISYTQTLSFPVRTLGRTMSELSKAGVSIARLREILDSSAEEPSEREGTPDLDADIVFEHVSFGYSDREVLSDVNFTVQRGTTFGILGATGSGKSTLTYLLNRLYELPEDGGRITIGGVDIRDIDRQHLRRGVGLVLQEPFLFSKTVGENIGIANKTPDTESIRAAAKTADVDDNIMEFRDGYDTMVGERGVTLSGGQKQRIAIARTLMMDCPIMVFDDSLSAVDMETDMRIRAELGKATGEKTVLLISHRINTLMEADRIIVLDNNTVAEEGTHEELLALGGLYSRVYRLQSTAHSSNSIQGGEY